MEDNSMSQGTFPSTGSVGYRAPSPRKPDIKEIIQHIRQCRDELTRNVLMLQQAALEQERTEQRFEGLAEIINRLIQVIKLLEAGAVVTDQWIRERDQVIAILQGILNETQQNESS
jgi:hypothetical protein